MDIVIEPRTISIGRTRELLSTELPPEIILSQATSSKRNIDPTVLVAGIGSSTALLVALVTGIFKILEQARSSKLIIVGASGRRIELPSGATLEELEQAVEVAKLLDVERIVLAPRGRSGDAEAL